MKLIIQIPWFGEQDQLPQTLRAATAATGTLAPPPSRATRLRAARIALPRSPYPYMAAGAIALALISMLSHSTPSYDPWAWLIWGREILHGSLSTFDGPSWKPLPIVFTTIFALFGHLQPNLWLIAARAGFILSLLMVFKVAARLVCALRNDAVTAETALGRATALERAARLAPETLAGLAAVTGLALVGGYTSDSAVGYSEGLAIAFMLIAFDRALDGHHRQAFLAGMVVAWDRPETWIAWGPYGLWLMWTDPRARRLVVGAALLTLVVWFVPQKLGGDSFTSGVARAQHPRPGSPAFASFPFYNELRYHAWDSVVRRAKAIAGLGSLASLIVTAIGVRREGIRTWLRSPSNRARCLIGLAGIAGVAWWVLIALETQAGFSGNDRYLQFGTTLVYICEGASLGWAAVALVRRLTRGGSRVPKRGGGSPTRPRAAALGLTLGLALIYAFLPSGWIGGDFVSIHVLRYNLQFQADLRIGYGSLIAQAGGYRAVNACGPVMTNNFSLPMTAWYLRREIHTVDAEPVVNAAGEAPVKPGHWPTTIFQNRASPGAGLRPFASIINGWRSQGARFTVHSRDGVTMYQDCPS